MATLAWISVYLAVGLLAVGSIWGILRAFDKSIRWGVITLLLAPAGIIAFLILTIRENYEPLLLIVGGLLLLWVAGSIVW